MLNLNLLRKVKGDISKSIRELLGRRLADVSLVDEVIVLDKQWRTGQFKLEQTKKDINQLHKEIKRLKIAKLDPIELIEKSEHLKKEIAVKEVDVKLAKKKLDERLSLVGNQVHDSVPVDKNEAKNSVLRTQGECKPKGKPINHVHLVNKLQFANLVKGSEVAGERSYYLNNEGVLLNDALVGFGLAFLYKRNYNIHHTPFFLRKEIMARCTPLFPLDEELYKVVGEKDSANEKCMISAAEQALRALLLDERIYPQSLPVKYAGHSTRFLAENGSYGEDALGLCGVDQYEELNLFCITSPDDNKSWEMQEEMLRDAEDFYKELGVPYRVVNVVSGALNHASAKTYRLEGWFPASQSFTELASCSNYTDFLTRGFGIKCVQKMNGEQTHRYLHLLNCTLTMTERTICFILENYQTKDGVVVPEVLRPFMLGIDFLPFKN